MSIRAHPGPSLLPALVSKVIEGLPFAFRYLDDILVFSANIKEHLEHIRVLFQTQGS